MITSVKLDNFLSHRDTELTFDNGITVFIGGNGAGKSSIIDAMTFALFGKPEEVLMKKLFGLVKTKLPLRYTLK